jgi:hypothetical protein
MLVNIGMAIPSVMIVMWLVVIPGKCWYALRHSQIDIYKLHNQSSIFITITITSLNAASPSSPLSRRWLLVLLQRRLCQISFLASSLG